MLRTEIPNDHSNVFVLPCGSDYMVYAPLARRLIRANRACVHQLQEYLRTGDTRHVDGNVMRAMGGLDWLRTLQAPAPLPVDRHFHPCHVTLFLTNRCNLRCCYCYAEAGEFAPSEMPESVSRAAIDLVCRNAHRTLAPMHLSFHGGGEPTSAWQTLTSAVSYAKSVWQSHAGRPIVLGITTNGVMPKEKAEFIATEFAAVTLSFDGPQDVQDAQRPLAGGGGSYDAVMSFVEILRTHGTWPIVSTSSPKRSSKKFSPGIKNTERWIVLLIM
jgi:uncharacterized protein